jgi:hypothetical protein
MLPAFASMESAISKRMPFFSVVESRDNRDEASRARSNLSRVEREVVTMAAIRTDMVS